MSTLDLIRAAKGCRMCGLGLLSTEWSVCPECAEHIQSAEYSPEDED